MTRVALAAIAATFMTSAAHAAQQDFTLVNDTGYTISEVYVSPSKSNDWEEDVLGRDLLEDGDQTKITFSRDTDACIWDIKAVYEDGDTAEWAKFNLCEVSAITIKYNAKTDTTSATYE